MDQLLKTAQDASSAALLEHLTSVTELGVSQDAIIGLKDSRNAILTAVYASELSTKDKKVIYDLFEANMKTLYVGSSMGWNPPAKKAELFAAESRFLVLRDTESGDLAGYTMFRFDTEEDAEDVLQPVLYCYELQISPSHQGQSLGKLLMNALEILASKYLMLKIMLTVFSANSAARSFYKRCDYVNDEICPSLYVEDDDSVPDYEILSKLIGPTKKAKSKKKKKKRKARQPEEVVKDTVA